MLDQIKEYTDVLTRDQFEGVEEHIRSKKWALHCSAEESANKMLWAMHDLENFDLFSVSILNRIKELTKMDLHLRRCYLNAQTTFMDGAEHIDSNLKDDYTFLIYMNREWKFEWGGETMFFDRYFDSDRNCDVENSLSYKLVAPFPNTAVFFPSVMYHYGRGPGRDFYGMRISLAFKLSLKL